MSTEPKSQKGDDSPPVPRDATPPDVLNLSIAYTESEAKRQIICPPDLVVTTEDFFHALSAQLTQNRLPATAQLRTVSWEDGQRPQQMILIAYSGDEAKGDTLRLVVGVKQMGNFVYVERMLTFLPPALPSVREKRKPLTPKALPPATASDNQVGMFAVAGIALLLIGISTALASGNIFMAAVSFGVFILPGWFLLSHASKISVTNDRKKVEQQNAEIGRKNQEIAQWNQAADKEREQLLPIIERWAESIAEYFYLARVDDVFGRWIGAVSVTIDQVIKKLFVDHQAQVEAWEVQQKTQQEMQEQLEKLKQTSLQ